MDALHTLVHWLVETIGTLGYPGILCLMFLESTFTPVPSELVMPPAGYLASQGKMNLYLVILMGTIGSILGACFNYYLAAWLGRPFFIKYGQYLLCPPHRFQKIESFFQRHGEFSTFIGRLILGVRHFISFPAGLAHMKISHFIFYTATGSFIWVTALTLIGYYFGKNQALFAQYTSQAAWWTLGICIGLILGYIFWHKRRTNSGFRPPPE